MDEAALVLFLTASLVVILAPGPDNILVLTRGVTLGRRAALVSAAGASTGLVCHSLFAAAGLSAVLASSATAYTVVKYVGAAYLIYLGIKIVARPGEIRVFSPKAGRLWASAASTARPSFPTSSTPR